MSDSNNVQAAVDAKHHLIVAHEVTNAGSDRGQLYNMAIQAKEALDVEALEVVADRDYFKGEEILACDQDNITTYLPKPQTSGSVKKGLYRKRDFIYHAEDDEYECPAGERLVWRFTTEREIAEVIARGAGPGRRGAHLPVLFDKRRSTGRLRHNYRVTSSGLPDAGRIAAPVSGGDRCRSYDQTGTRLNRHKTSSA